MVALPMIYPSIASAIWRALQDGEIEEAFTAYSSATPFLHVSLGAPDFVAVIKIVLHHNGVIASDAMRPPLVAPSTRRRAEIVASLASYNRA
jgi:dihydrodipicolinate synthase/N-acetylneuraminate lyase